MNLQQLQVRLNELKKSVSTGQKAMLGLTFLFLVLNLYSDNYAGAMAMLSLVAVLLLGINARLDLKKADATLVRKK